MPVVQKTGPDGCLYILDWYDRYHCYQDANRDPPGLDRLKGRLYRVAYKDTPPRRSRSTSRRSPTDELVKHARPPQRLVAAARRSGCSNERLDDAARAAAPEDGARHRRQPNNAHMHALWLLVSRGGS